MRNRMSLNRPQNDHIQNLIRQALNGFRKHLIGDDMISNLLLCV
jgi:hypothetical protein